MSVCFWMPDLISMSVVCQMKQIASLPGEPDIVTVSSHNMFKEGVMPRFDWGVGFRAGVEIARHVQIAIGYDWGMTKLISIIPIPSSGLL